MKAIKIEAKNKAAIESALKAVNGKSDAHAYTTMEEVVCVANDYEKKVVKLVGAKARAVGAIAYSESGGSVPDAYKYSRHGTSLKIERRSTGWFLVDVKQVEIYKDGGRDRLFLTAEQDAAAIDELRKAYSIIKPAE